ncbi:MAG: hypothetical protein QM760_14815 [Nibricoccus sp.]
MAREIIQSNAPDVLKKKARRLIEQREIEGKALNLEELGLGAMQGKPLVIYAWTYKQPQVLKMIEYCSRNFAVNFVGINIDEDKERAQAVLSQHPVSGLQFYDAGGLEGPLASKLKFTMVGSLYIVDAGGVLIDTGAAFNPLSKIAQVLGGRRAGK